MSVIRSQRRISDTEFENTFMQLYRFSREKTAHLPKRKRRWLSTDIDIIMNRVYRNIMEINECYFRDKCEKVKYVQGLSEKSVDLLQSLDKHLMVLWNIEHYKTKTMAHWVEFIDKEISLLNLIYNTDRSVEIMILDWDKIHTVEFLRNMSNLHRYTYSKVLNASVCYDDTEGALLISLIDDAFNNVMKANQKIPTTKDEYIIRSKYISKAISCLKQMNRRMLAYFNLMQYSERIMREWSDMLVKEITLLTGLQKSDKRRFENLK